MVILLARQRSGTTVLRSVLEHHPDIHCLPEVFNANPSPYDTSRFPDVYFFDWLEANARPSVPAVLRSRDAMAELFDAYMEFLRARSDKRFVIVDVKYNSAHHFDGPWRSLNELPLLFELIEQRRVRVMHLVRSNYLRTYLSLRRAQTTREYYVPVESGGTAADPTLRLEPEEVVRAAEAYEHEDRLVIERFGDYELAAGLEYDDLFPVMGAPPAAEVLAAIAGWLGLEPDFPDPEPAFRKQNVRTLRESIENYDEVAAALTGTRFEYCLHDERMYRG